MFVQLVLQQTNMALIFLGKIPHPESNESEVDLEAARMFIDVLEMIEAKTKGNLSAGESRMLQESLMTVRMQFVEVAGSEPAGKEPQASPAAAAQTSEARSGAGGGGASESPPSQPTAVDDDTRKKFVKKY
jgi:hypothetical protein